MKLKHLQPCDCDICFHQKEVLKEIVKEINILKKHLKSYKQKGVIGDLSEEGLLDYKGTMKNIDEFKKRLTENYLNIKNIKGV